MKVRNCIGVLKMDEHIVAKTIEVLNNKAEIINPTKPRKKLNVSLFKKNKKRVTVVTPVYNAEATIEKCINSVISQSLSFDEIEYILVDDFSTDDSANILRHYAKKYPNITVVLLNKNTGTAAIPRNIGIELATTDKLMFLDADDWLDKKGIERLVTLMDETGDDFAIGKTIKVTDKSETIHAEFMSYYETKHANPFDLPYLFYHMGPPSKMMKTAILKENNIRFPELKFGEDKYFFYRVLLNCERVSIINEPIYYVNRLTENNASLTRVTAALDKRYVDVEILKKVLAFQLPDNKEKVLVKRLVEYDLIKTCDSVTFIKSKKKHEYIQLLRETLSLLKDKNYQITETFDSMLYRYAAELIMQERDEDVIKLFEWYKTDKNKPIVIQNNIAHYEVPFLPKDSPYKMIPIPLYARFTESYVKDNHFVHELEIYGEKIDRIHYVLVRDRAKLDNELKLPIEIQDNKGIFKIPIEQLDQLQNGLFTIFIRYDGHKLINIKHKTESKIVYHDREMTMYISKADNVSFSIKNS